MTQQFIPAVEDSYHRLLEHLPGMAYRCRVENKQKHDGSYQYRLEFVSRGSFKLLGIPAEDMMEQNMNVIERMVHPDELESMRQHISDKLVAHEPYQLTYRIILPGGLVKWVWDQGEGVWDPDGNLSYLEGLLMDISEQKMVELNLREENRQFKISSDTLFGLGGMIGKSEAMHSLYNMVLKAAETDTNTIIYGETGVGKDVTARAIHTLSGRKGPYVPVNCGAIPESLMESEFFGHTKGAFSGAVSNKDGYIGAADNGTLFLDEIGELPLKLQVKLLRALENKMYTPVGSTVPKTSRFRLIAATNQDLAEMVRNKTMRSDFYYRIHVLCITVPPLRERLGDLPLLSAAWMEKRGQTIDIPLHVRLAMEHYSWPGNIRELHNFLDRYAAFGDAALESLGESRLPVIDRPEVDTSLSLEEATLQLEEEMIRRALEKCHWRRNEAAQCLGVNIRTLQRKMKRLGMNS